ncbi:MAG: hypothetical protein V4500_02075 [Pseudomonadota bacterium]
MISFENAEVFLPKYLSPEGRKQLFSEIKKFDGINYYSSISDSEPLQGDGWSNVEFVDVESLTKLSTSVVVLSNSCDISSDNARKMPPRITVTPLIRLSKLSALLAQHNLSQEQIDQYTKDLRAQVISNALYLPAGSGLEEDAVVLFDNVQSQQLNKFSQVDNKTRLFSLSQFAFWLFLVKLAIHYCRAQEGILRPSGE